MDWTSVETVCEDASPVSSPGLYFSDWYLEGLNRNLAFEGLDGDGAEEGEADGVASVERKSQSIA